MSTKNVIVKNGDRMMTHAITVEEGIEITFADGGKGVIPFFDVPEIGEYANLASMDLPNPYEIILNDLVGETIEIPWDFARHYCDPSYKLRVEEVASEGKQTFGAQVRRLRKSAGFTQKELAKSAGISRVTLVRIENDEQYPRYENIMALARSLALPPERLLVSPP